MSKQMKLKHCLFSIDLKQSIMPAVFFHWCKLFFVAIVLLMVEDLISDFSYLGLHGVDESAGRFVCEVWFVAL